MSSTLRDFLHMTKNPECVLEPHSQSAAAVLMVRKEESCRITNFNYIRLINLLNIAIRCFHQFYDYKHQITNHSLIFRNINSAKE